MIRRTTVLVALLGLLIPTVGFGAGAMEGKALTACEKKADKRKITEPKKRANFIKKCEKKHPK